MADKQDMTAPMLSLDATLDDIEALPSFGMFPTGAYKVTLPDGIAEKSIGDKHFFDIQVKLDVAPGAGEYDPSSLEFGEAAPAAGDVCNFLFDRQHKKGQSLFADFCAPISAKFGCKTVREVIEKSKGLQMLLVIKRDKNKETGKVYGNIKHCGVI